MALPPGGGHGCLVVSVTVEPPVPEGPTALLSLKRSRVRATAALGQLSRLRLLVAESLEERPDVVQEDVGQFIRREVAAFVMDPVLLKVVVLL